MSHINPKIYRSSSEKIPFYAWECLSIILSNRTVNLIIRNENQMMMFINFLIYRTNSIDGTKNSGL